MRTMHKAVEAEINRRTPPEWYGLASPHGWDSLVEKLFLMLLNRNPDLEIHQIKEKFGELRFYCNARDEWSKNLIREIEKESLGTCQNCGTTEQVSTNRSGCIATLCETCRDTDNTNGYPWDG